MVSSREGGGEGGREGGRGGREDISLTLIYKQHIQITTGGREDTAHLYMYKWYNTEREGRK